MKNGQPEHYSTSVTIGQAMHHRALVAAFSLAILVVVSGCASSPSKPPDAALQAQRSITLAGGRYVQVLEALTPQRGLDDTKRALDYWIDLAILELLALEAHYPKTQWSEIAIESEVGLKMNVAYRAIARFRRENPRTHSVPLDASEVKSIEAFLMKYE